MMLIEYSIVHFIPILYQLNIEFILVVHIIG